MVIFSLSLSLSSSFLFQFSPISSIDLLEFHFSNEARGCVSIHTFNEPLVNRAMLHFAAPRLSIDLMRFHVSCHSSKWNGPENFDDLSKNRWRGKGLFFAREIYGMMDRKRLGMKWSSV